MEEKIKFETAKIAKQKGFDWACQESYNEELGFLDYKDAREDKSYKNHNESNSSCSAPTQSLLQKWLREVHKIIVLPHYDAGDEVYIVLTFVPEGEHIVLYSGEDVAYSSYEESLEDGLFEALKLI